jgi:hypothetical protein
MKRQRLALLLFGFLLLPGAVWDASANGAAPPVQSEQWIAVVAPAFRPALEPLCEARRRQGLEVRVVVTTDVLTTAEIRRGESGKLRDHLHRLCRAHPGHSCLLLVGAIEAQMGEAAERVVVPPLVGTIGRMKGQPSDNGYGCPDGGLAPTVAVGRFPVRTEAEARGLVRRTLAFESEAPGDWKRRLTVLAGVPAYNPVVDKLVENLALARLEHLAPSWTGQAIYSNPHSRFCVPDQLLRKTALRHVEEGAAFVLYLGHSSAEGLYGGTGPYLERSDFARLKIARGAGVFITFGCNGCQLKGAEGEGYGVSAIRNVNGPAAVLGSHGICFAAMVQLGADALFRQTFQGELPPRLGSVWLALKQGVERGSIDALTYRMLDTVDGDRRIPQAVQRQEHLEMFVLLGDPALRLPRVPHDLKVETSAAVPGQVLRVKGKAPARLEGAPVRVSLERSASSHPADLETLPRKSGFDRDSVMMANFARANRFAVATAETTVREGRFSVEVQLPKRVPWPRLILRVHAANDREEAQTATRIGVER